MSSIMRSQYEFYVAVTAQVAILHEQLAAMKEQFLATYRVDVFADYDRKAQQASLQSAPLICVLLCSIPHRPAQPTLHLSNAPVRCAHTHRRYSREHSAALGLPRLHGRRTGGRRHRAGHREHGRAREQYVQHARLRCQRSGVPLLLHPCRRMYVSVYTARAHVIPTTHNTTDSTQYDIQQPSRLPPHARPAQSRPR